MEPGLKPGSFFRGLVARLKSCPSRACDAESHFSRRTLEMGCPGGLVMDAGSVVPTLSQRARKDGAPGVNGATDDVTSSDIPCCNRQSLFPPRMPLGALGRALHHHRSSPKGGFGANQARMQNLAVELRTQ